MGLHSVGGILGLLAAKLWEKQRESQGVTAVDRSMFAARHVTQKLKAQALSEMNAENCLN